MLRSVEVKAHMTVSPVTLLPSTSIFDAIKALLDRNISGATVVDDDGNVVGIISEMDCLQAILSGSYHGEVGGTVAEYMTKEVETVSADATVLDVAKLLVDGHRRRFPVVVGSKFQGQVSCRSILGAVLKMTEKD